jgi:hypothetical protein
MKRPAIGSVVHYYIEHWRNEYRETPDVEGPFAAIVTKTYGDMDVDLEVFGREFHKDIALGHGSVSVDEPRHDKFVIGAPFSPTGVPERGKCAWTWPE